VDSDPTIAQSIGARATQEDRAVMAGLGSGCTVAILADGMGGHARGDVAAQVACEAALATLQRAYSLPTADPWDAVAIVGRAVRSAADAVRGVDCDPRTKPPGCTLIVAVRWPDAVVLAHVGDSIAWVCAERMTTQHGWHHLLRSCLPTCEHVEMHVREIPQHHEVVIASNGVESHGWGTAEDIVRAQLGRSDPGQDNATAVVLTATPLPADTVVWAQDIDSAKERP